MAIQLNDRDYLIFKLLDEHQVLLEKHIAWFITNEDKPVLIRDRLRKLFYLDYLLCQRHDTKLPWWTTPTKPLVYMLAPLARTISGAKANENNIFDCDWQQRHLEIANIRMIFLIAQKEELVRNFQWITCHPAMDSNKQVFDAFISCAWTSVNHRIGLISHPEISTELAAQLEQELVSGNVTDIMIISRDQSHQENLQKLLSGFQAKTSKNNIVFATHQDLYKSGLNKTCWLNLNREQINFSGLPQTISPSSLHLDSAFGDIHTASA